MLLAVALLVFACNSGSGSGSASSGPTFTTFDAPNIVVTAMNNDGVIVGYYSETVRPDHGFIRSVDGTFTTYDVPNAAIAGTQITAINNLGDIAGSYADQSGNSFGFVRTNNNQVTALTYVMYSHAGSPSLLSPTSLNDDGFVVGYVSNPPSQCVIGFEGAFPILYSINIGDAFTNYCSATQPRQVSANGSIIGSFVDQRGMESGFLYPPSYAPLVTLTISPGVGALPASINASGTIVGSADIHSFLRTSDGAYTTFDPPGAASSSAVSINASGLIVGNFVDNGSISHAYLRNPNGTLVILDAPGTGQSPVSGTYVVAINDSGAIAGWYTDANAVRHGFVRK